MTKIHGPGHGARSDKDRVGYKRPPKAHQFQKGISGNPRGRKKRTSDFAAILQGELTETVDLKVGDKRKSVPIVKALVMRLLREAVLGPRTLLIPTLQFIERHAIGASDCEPDLSLLDDEEFDALERLLKKAHGNNL
ncbi:DUF5681 domain-containing protein [Sphingomonas flavescens]|uniref:DUF5681 domain-containing protein n=1 Tax=Sphingomonas flavescens TaxID=3132797 RepID=UPI002803C2F9|nr:DUF5681 domain-containing protein [Sphingomonas limnosediminicola]